MMPFISSLEVDFSCPEEVSVEEEFVCNIQVTDFEGHYDVKVFITGANERIAQIWTGEKWQTAYWYVKDFIQDETSKELRLKINKEFEGAAEVLLRLRP